MCNVKNNTVIVYAYNYEEFLKQKKTHDYEEKRIVLCHKLLLGILTFSIIHVLRFYLNVIAYNEFARYDTILVITTNFSNMYVKQIFF